MNIPLTFVKIKKKITSAHFDMILIQYSNIGGKSCEPRALELKGDSP